MDQKEFDIESLAALIMNIVKESDKTLLSWGAALAISRLVYWNGSRDTGDLIRIGKRAFDLEEELTSVKAKAAGMEKALKKLADVNLWGQDLTNPSLVKWDGSEQMPWHFAQDALGAR